MSMDDLIERSPEVAAAQAAGRPVVALESTIITHGMPYPQNLETARAVEAAVRAAGATPATIAVMGGRLKVGLTEDALGRWRRPGAWPSSAVPTWRSASPRAGSGRPRSPRP
jgi:pseudouridine-5'-phosphate glycosidase